MVVECHGWTATALREKLDELPERPGVYLYRDAANRLLYVGKGQVAARARPLVLPGGAQHAPRTVSLVAEIADLETIVVDTEMEALMLEANLIKKERPPYNVVLRDDKSFPYLKLSLADEYPRVSLVRRARLDKNAYYGPFLPGVDRAALAQDDSAILPGRHVRRGLRRQEAAVPLLPPRSMPGTVRREDQPRRSTEGPSPTRSCSSRDVTGT